MWLAIWVLILAGVLSRPASAGPVTADGARVVRLADGFAFTEGPTCAPDGAVYFTDQPNDRILVWSADGKLSTLLQPCGRANGLCFDATGTLWACADEAGELWAIDVRTKKVKSTVKRFGDGPRLNGPNDLWAHRDGSLYLTDPYYRRPYWSHSAQPRAKQAVYRVDRDGKTVTCVADDLVQPNGIIGSPDGKTLYVAEIGAGKTYAYRIAADGSLADKRLFCSMGSDGMTLDVEGNVYLTGRGVTVFDREGRQIEQIAVPEGWTSNVCFGGRDRKTLFITAGKALYSIGMRVKGAGSQ